MDIASKTVTQRVHEATATVADLRAVATSAVMRQLGLSADTHYTATAESQADGSIKVTVVEDVVEAPKTATPQAPQIPPGIDVPQLVI